MAFYLELHVGDKHFTTGTANRRIEFDVKVAGNTLVAGAGSRHGVDLAVDELALARGEGFVDQVSLFGDVGFSQCVAHSGLLKKIG